LYLQVDDLLHRSLDLKTVGQLPIEDWSEADFKHQQRMPKQEAA